MAKKDLSMSHFTMDNSDDINRAIEGLSIFCHSFCMNCAETEKKNDLVFRCKECPFLEKDTDRCFVKVFLSKYATDIQKDRATCMGWRC